MRRYRGVRQGRRAEASLGKGITMSTQSLGEQTVDLLADLVRLGCVNDLTADWVAIAGAGRVTKGRYAVRHSLATAQRVDSTMGAARSTGEVIAPLASSKESTTKSVAPGVPR